MSTLDFFIILFAVAAAILWFISAIIKIPKNFAIHVVTPNMPKGSEPILLDGEYVGNAFSEDLQTLVKALTKQSRFSAFAASCAGISAVLQVISLMLKIHC